MTNQDVINYLIDKKDELNVKINTLKRDVDAYDSVIGTLQKIDNGENWLLKNPIDPELIYKKLEDEKSRKISLKEKVDKALVVNQSEIIDVSDVLLIDTHKVKELCLECINKNNRSVNVEAVTFHVMFGMSIDATTETLMPIVKRSLDELHIEQKILKDLSEGSEIYARIPSVEVKLKKEFNKPDDKPLLISLYNTRTANISASLRDKYFEGINSVDFAKVEGDVCLFPRKEYSGEAIIRKSTTGGVNFMFKKEFIPLFFPKGTQDTVVKLLIEEQIENDTVYLKLIKK